MSGTSNREKTAKLKRLSSRCRRLAAVVVVAAGVVATSLRSWISPGQLATGAAVSLLVCLALIGVGAQLAAEGDAPLSASEILAESLESAHEANDGADSQRTDMERIVDRKVGSPDERIRQSTVLGINEDGGIVLVPDEFSQHHLWVLGGTRSGKSARNMWSFFKQEIGRGDTVPFYVDLKGEDWLFHAAKEYA